LEVSAQEQESGPRADTATVGGHFRLDGVELGAGNFQRQHRTAWPPGRVALGDGVTDFRIANFLGLMGHNCLSLDRYRSRNENSQTKPVGLSNNGITRLSYRLGVRVSVSIRHRLMACPERRASATALTLLK